MRMVLMTATIMSTAVSVHFAHWAVATFNALVFFLILVDEGTWRSKP